MFLYIFIYCSIFMPPIFKTRNHNVILTLYIPFEILGGKGFLLLGWLFCGNISVKCVLKEITGMKKLPCDSLPEACYTPGERTKLRPR